MSKLLQTKRFIWLLSFLLVSALFAFGYSAGKRYFEQANWVQHTLSVSASTQLVLASVTDAETGQRGFLLTGDERFLDSYKAGLVALPRELEKLRALTSDNSAQQRRIAELAPLIEQKQKFAAETIQTKRSGGDYVRLVASGRGKALMDRIRRLVGEMQTEEETLLVERSERARKSQASLVAALVTGSLLTLVLILVGLLMAQRDVQELTKLTEELATTEEKFRAMADHASDLVRQMLPDGTTTYVSPSVWRLLGYTPDELMALPARELVHPDDAEKARAELAPLLQGERAHDTLNVRYRAKSGEWRWFEASYSTMRGEGGVVRQIQVAARDIDDRKRAEEELARMNEELKTLSLRDALTTLPNRRGFLELSHQQLKTAQRERRFLGVMFVDLDGLKPINDQLGHEMGDRAIAEAGRVLRGACRGPDVVARLGGDEFAVVGLDLCPDNFHTFRTRLDEALELANAESRRSFRLSFSVGVAFRSGEDPDTLDDLLKRADADMYEQKRARKLARE